MTIKTAEENEVTTMNDAERAAVTLATLVERGDREGKERSILQSLSDPVRDALADFERGAIDDLSAEVSGKQRTELQMRAALLIREGFQSNIPGLMNDKYSRAHLLSRIHEMVGIAREEGTTAAMEHAKRSAFLQFDLDGLKAVNDLGSMALGNAYLRKFGAAMEDVKQELGRNGAHVVLTRDGGDEFGMFVSFGDRPCTQKEIEQIVHMVQERFAKQSNGLLNLQDPEIREKMTAKGLTIPEEGAFHGTVSGGGMSMEEALVAGQEYIAAADAYDRSLDVLAGDVLRETAIERAKKQKTIERLRWTKGTTQEKSHAALLEAFRGIPVETVEHLERQVDDLQEEVARLRAENAELQLALQAREEPYVEKRKTA